MRFRRPDRALRKLVAELAIVHPDDLGAILKGLDEEEQARVEALLAEYRTKTVTLDLAPEEAAPPKWGIEGASPWLMERIEPSPAGGGSAEAGSFSMTETAQAALRAAAEPFRAPLLLEARPDSRGPSLAGRVKQIVLRRGA